MDLVNIILIVFVPLILILITAIFITKIEITIYLFYATGLSIQYLELIRIGTFSVLDLVGGGIPILLFLGFLFNKNKNISREFFKDIIIPIFFLLCFFVFFNGTLLSSGFFPERSPYTLVEKLGFAGKFYNGFFVLWIVSAFFDDKTKLNKLLSCMLFCLVVPGVFGFWEILNGTTKIHGTAGYPMPWAFFHHPGVVAYGFVCLLPVALFKHSEAVGFISKTFWTVSATLMVIFLYFTYRRTVWVGLIVQLFMWFFLFQKNKHRFIYSFLGALLCIGIFIFGTQSNISFVNRLGDIATFFNNIPDVFTSDRFNFLFTGRWGFFRGYLIYIANQPVINMILGNGVGSTAFASWSALQTEGGGHNCYAILFIEFGLLSFILYFTVVFFLYLKSFKLLRSKDSFNRQYAKLFMTLLTSYLVMGLGTHIFYELTSGIWVFWGLGGALLGLFVTERRRNQGTNSGIIGDSRI